MSALYVGHALDSQSVAPRPYKRCACGREYSRLQWLDLPLAGRQHWEADEDEPALTIESRHCVCLSTIAIEVTP